MGSSSRSTFTHKFCTLRTLFIFDGNNPVGQSLEFKDKGNMNSKTKENLDEGEQK